jgi:uncharacterized UPF0160 family protein
MDFINKEFVDAIELQSKIGSELATLIYAYYDKRTLENKGKVMEKQREFDTITNKINNLKKINKNT